MDEPLSAEAIQKIQNDYFIQFILDNSRVLEELHHKLKGETLVEEEKEIDGQKVLIPTWRNKWNLKPVLNDDGINFVMNTLNMALSVTNATGNINEEQVSMLSQIAYQNIITVFRLNKERFAFENEASMSALSDQLMTIIYTHLSKSKEGGFLKQMSTSYSYNEIRDGNTKEIKEPNMTI